MIAQYFNEFNAIETAKKKGEPVPELSDVCKEMVRQDEFELNFNKHEK
jgi:hypothetical protein